jgi:hypothetical protein
LETRLLLATSKEFGGDCDTAIAEEDVLDFLACGVVAEAFFT